MWKGAIPSLPLLDAFFFQEFSKAILKSTQFSELEKCWDDRHRQLTSYKLSRAVFFLSLRAACLAFTMVSKSSIPSSSSPSYWSMLDWAVDSTVPDSVCWCVDDGIVPKMGWEPEAWEMWHLGWSGNSLWSPELVWVRLQRLAAVVPEPEEGSHRSLAWPCLNHRFVVRCVCSTLLEWQSDQGRRRGSC